MLFLGSRWHPGRSVGRARIYWRSMPGGWARRLTRSVAPRRLPVLVESPGAMPEGPDADLSAQLAGVLLCWWDAEEFQFAGDRSQLHRFLADWVEDMRLLTGADSIAGMVRREAAAVTARHGSLPGARMLAAGRSMVPDDVTLASGLVVELWRALALDQVNPGDRRAAFDYLASVCGGLDSRRLDPDTAAMTRYMELVALAMTGRRAETARRFWRGAVREVPSGWLRARLLKLVNDPCPEFSRYSGYRVDPSRAASG